MTLKKLLNFVKFTQRFRATNRYIFAVGENRMENDVEHSFQLAIITWYVIENEKLKLNSDLAIKYALIHDLEESLTGDKNIFDEKGRRNKKLDEIKARSKIIKMFPGWKGYRKLSLNYKKLVDNESKLVNGLDKILPVINIYLDGGRTWKQEDTTLKMLSANKRIKVTVHPISEKLWKPLEKKLKNNEFELFGKLSPV